MAWNRLVEMRVGKNVEGDPTALLVSDLDIEFVVKRSVTFSNNSAAIRVFNAKESTRNEVLRAGNSVVLGAGYEDEHKPGNLPTIFIGNIIFATNEKVGSEWITYIEAGVLQSAKTELEYLTASLSYSKGTPATEPIRALALIMGLAVAGEDNAAGILLNNGWAFAGSPRQGLAELRQRLRPSGLDIFVDNSEVIIYRVGSTTGLFGAVLLSPDTGLLQVKKTERQDKKGDKDEEDKKRIEFTALLNPKIQPNGLIVISGANAAVNGTYVVEDVTFVGNNFGGSFHVSGEALA